MSEQNVELYRRAIDAFNARDEEAFIAFIDPSVEYISQMTVPGGGIYYGHDGVRKFLRDLEDAWGDEIRVEPETFFDLGERTLVFYVVRGRGRHSGAEVAMSYAAVAAWRDGLMVHWKAYPDREDALKDLDVSEDALEPIAP